MHLKTLSLGNFRNFTSQQFDFNPEFNFIIGKNAQGKTNVIEAIYYLSELKSFRTTNRMDLMQKGVAFATIKAGFEKNDLCWDINITLSENGRQVLLNNKKPAAHKDYYELIPLILFEPRHIYLFRDSPSERRRYLDRALFLQDAGYLVLLRSYEKIISQKNKILKENQNPSLLEVWNEQLVETATQIVSLRLNLMQCLNNHLSYEYQKISNSNETLALSYCPGQNLFAEIADPFHLNTETIRKLITDKLKSKFNEELCRRESLVGPHRDDFSAHLDERSVGQFASQGENRSALIALKLAQLKMYAQKFSRTPLFLLDDVASELDENRCHYLFSYLKDESTQVFITTTDNQISGRYDKGHFTTFFIENGTASAL